MILRTLAAAGLAWLWSGVEEARPQPAQAIQQDSWGVTGLRAPAEIVVDRWGIPHIYAASSRDAFFVQGYNAARDRLWQIDLWRKRGLGRLSASFGPAYVAQDRAARLFLYRGDMAVERAAYGPGAQEALEGFTDGLNAYVDEVGAGSKPLPIEFQLTDSRPERWSAEDVLRIRSHALVSNVVSEVTRSQIACAAGLAADRFRIKLEPPHQVRTPQGLDPCDISLEILSDYQLGTQPVRFEALRRTAASAEAPAPLAERAAAASTEGSNNWVIAPSRTATGRPILASDPHRAVGTPSLRYLAHLEAPGLSIIGAGEPALPGVSLGHNGEVAFGLTIFPIDQEDLYVYETRGNAYRYRSRWAPMRVVRETLEVKGEPARTVELHFTRHGPVLAQDPARHRAFALRSVWSAPGAVGYLQSARFWRAKSWDEFAAGRMHWGAPPVNLVYADRAGAIGWAAAGLAPVRPNWDGLMPAPGDGRYEWAGYRPQAQLPSEKNPAAGFVATANAMNLPPGYPNEARRIAFEWIDPSRLNRLNEVLAADTKATLAGSMSLQTDSVSTQSRRAVALLRPLSSDDRDLAAALNLLKAWDNDVAVESAAAALYEVWANKHLGGAVVAAAAPAAARPLLGRGSLEAAITFLESPEAASVRERVLLESLAGATVELRRRLGQDPKGWSWGRLHRAEFSPAVSVLADPQTAAAMRVGPVPVPGSSSTPVAAGYRLTDFNQVTGASVRLVLDVGAWDNSVAINSPGQSGDPASPHYRDLFPLWAAGDYVPLRFGRKAVLDDAERVILLRPR